MKTNPQRNRNIVFTLALLIAALPLVAGAQQESIAKRVDAIKATLAASRKALKQYEWIETTVISVNGEDKTSREERCYYGADGGIERIELDQTSAPGPRFGLRKRIAERKKEEMTDFMKSATALIKSYIPPNTAKLQASKDAGNASLEMIDPGRRAQLNCKDYEKPGDTLGVEVDLTNNHLLGISVTSYVNDPLETVTLQVKMGQLDDGTTYPASATLTVPEKNLKVEMENSGYRKMN